MSTIPSIAMIPSGYKANKVYSVLPTDGAADLTFARTSSATRVNSNNLIEEVATGAPRLDYTDGACPSLLLEPQSTNLITYPLSFDNAYWTKSGASVTGGFSAPSVDNPTSAFKLVEDTSNSQHWFYKDISLSANTSYTISIFAKYSGRKNMAINIYNGSSSDYAYYDIQNGTILNTPTDAKATITPISNSWYRLTYTREALTTGANYRIALADNTPSVSYIGDGTSGVYIFGAQLEEQSFATSLMLPNTEGSTVTRVAETASKTGLSSYINSEEGVLYAEISSFENDGNYSLIALSDGTSSNRLYIGFSSVSNTIMCVLQIAGSSQFTFTTVVNPIIYNKLAIKFKENDFALWINGVEVATDTGGNTYAANTLNFLTFSSGSGGSIFYGKCKDLRVYKTALTDAELVTLTTI